MLKSKIRNSLNGDFEVVNNLDKIDQYPFLVVDFSYITLVLPVSFEEAKIIFTDRK